MPGAFVFDAAVGGSLWSVSVLGLVVVVEVEGKRVGLSHWDGAGWICGRWTVQTYLGDVVERHVEGILE